MDKLIHGLAADATVRVMAAITTDAVREAVRAVRRYRARAEDPLEAVPVQVSGPETRTGAEAGDRLARQIFSAFYRASGVSGQLGPFFLETLLNPDLTGPERPAVLAHEWAHLSGYAPESDASFVGLLAAMRASGAGTSGCGPQEGTAS